MFFSKEWACPLFCYEGLILIMNEIEKNVSEIVLPVINQLGYELFDVSFHKEGGEDVLDLIIDKEDGICLDDCEKVSSNVEGLLDEKDPIECAYILSVSSPGADRPLRNDKDFDKNIGKKIDVRLYQVFEGKKVHVGELLSYDEERITIIDRNKKITIPKDVISLVRQYVDFN